MTVVWKKEINCFPNVAKKLANRKILNGEIEMV